MNAMPLAIVTGLLAAGCNFNDCDPGGLGPVVGWSLAQPARANTGEPVSLDLELSARTVVGGHVQDHHCEPDYESLEGTAQVQPVGGDAVVRTVNGALAVTVPYATDISFQFDPDGGGTFMDRWLLPSVFEVAASTVGSSLRITWTTPTPLPPDAGEVIVDVTSTEPGSLPTRTSVPDTGTYDMALTLLTTAGAYDVSVGRGHPDRPNRLLTIVTRYLRP
jgi:hypothetical protein